MTKLSIIIPALNEEDYLPELLDSIKRQNFTDYEIIVADADSADRTRDIAEMNGCIVVRGGLPAKGRNAGARVAKAELLIFIDADVTIPENFLNSSLNEFKERKLDVAGCSFRTDSKQIFDRAIFGLANTLFLKLEKRWPLAGGCGILVKRNLHEQINGFDERLLGGEDFDYVQCAAKVGRFGILRNKKMAVSARRLDSEGRTGHLLKVLVRGLYPKKITKPFRINWLNHGYGHDSKKRKIK